MIRFGYFEDLLSLPAIHALVNNHIQHPFKMMALPEAQILKKLQEGNLDMGILSPYYYARKQGSVRILKEFTIVSRVPIASSLLFFRGNLKTIEEVYWKRNPQAQFEHFLGKLVLEEFMGVESEWKEFEADLEVEELLLKYPVILLTGEDAYRASDSAEGMIDLTEEWLLKTDLPIVQRLIVVRDTFKDSGELETLHKSIQVGIRRLKSISEDFAYQKQRNWDIYFNILQKLEFSGQTPEVWDSLREFLQYMFYKGEADYYPEMEFFD